MAAPAGRATCDQAARRVNVRTCAGGRVPWTTTALPGSIWRNKWGGPDLAPLFLHQILRVWACPDAARALRRARPEPLGHVEGTAVTHGGINQVHTPADLHLLGGRDRRRSGDLALFRRALCQLSYPTGSAPEIRSLRS